MDQKGLFKAIKTFNKDYVKNLKKLAPFRTGTLKESIRSFAEIAGDTVKSGVEMEYYGEFVKKKGTHNKEYNPFKEDAFKDTRLDRKFDDVMEEYLDTQFEHTFNK